MAMTPQLWDDLPFIFNKQPGEIKSRNREENKRRRRKKNASG